MRWKVSYLTAFWFPLGGKFLPNGLVPYVSKLPPRWIIWLHQFPWSGEAPPDSLVPSSDEMMLQWINWKIWGGKVIFRWPTLPWGGEVLPWYLYLRKWGATPTDLYCSEVKFHPNELVGDPKNFLNLGILNPPIVYFQIHVWTGILMVDANYMSVYQATNRWLYTWFDLMDIDLPSLDNGFFSVFLFYWINIFLCWYFFLENVSDLDISWGLSC